MRSLETYTGTVYGYPVRFVRWPIPADAPRHQRKTMEQNPRIVVLLDDLVTAMDLRPAGVSLLRDALNLWCCGWDGIPIGRKRWDAPIAEFTRPLVEIAYRNGLVGRRALADYDKALGEAMTALRGAPISGGR